MFKNLNRKPKNAAGSASANSTESVNSSALDSSRFNLNDADLGNAQATASRSASTSVNLTDDAYEFTNAQYPNWITITAQPGTQSQFYTDFPNESSKEITVELKLVDGTKLVDTFNRDRIYRIREKKNSAGKKCTSFKYMSAVNVRDDKNDELFEVDCSLHDLCYLLKIEYIPFSKTLLEKAVKGDNV